MRILILSTNGVINDGITSWIIQTFDRIDRTGVELVDTTAFEGDFEAPIIEQLRRAGVRPHIVPHRKKRPIAYMRALRRMITTNRYDVVHVNGNSGTVALELLCCIGAGVKARIVHSRNTKGEYQAFDKLLRPAMYGLSTDRVACGRDAGRWLFPRDEFIIIPNGRDFGKYRFEPGIRERVRQELGLSNRHIAIGHVGNFNAQKNHRFLIEAFASALEQNSDVRLLLVGDGLLRHKVEAQVCRLGLEDHVVFLGRSSRVPEYLCAFDLAVLPSLYEGFPNVAIEWQINGLRSILSATVTDECAVTDLVTFLPLGDKSAWASAMAGAVPVDRVAVATEAQRLLKQAGYEATEGAARLRKLYSAIEDRQKV